MWHCNDKHFGVMALHVDDVLCAETDFFIEIYQNFSVGGEENCSFRYLGLNIQLEKIHIVIDQNNYIEQLKKVGINPVRKFPPKCNFILFRKKNIKSKNWSTSLDIKSHSTRY